MPDKTMRLEYHLRDDVDVSAYLPHLAAFAGALRAEPACRSYQPFQAEADPRHFLHLGVFSGELAFTSAPWFTAFTARLRGLTVAPPSVLWLAPAVRDS
ncbi:MAG TPA: hypothetical protein VGM88_15575 [Kofleriaceae bacterium]|jgi:quinol monooxygenase YgiN